MHRRTLALIILLVLLIGISAGGLPFMATAVVPFGDASQLLADSTWPAIGADYRHTGRAEAVGPSLPATRWRTQIVRQEGLMDENAFMRSTMLGANGFLYVGAGMPGVYRLRATDGALVAPSLFSVRHGPNGEVIPCASGETWVEDVTIGADNTLFFVNEGGCVWAVDGNTLQIKWQKSHGFLHAPPTLYPHPDFGTVVFIISPDGYVKGLRASDGALVLRYRYTNGTGNKESVREKGFAIDGDGTLYFGWKDRVFSLNPLSYNASGDMAAKAAPIVVPALTAGPVGPIVVDGQSYLFFTGDATFVRVNLTTRAVKSYGLGSTLCGAGVPFCDSTTASKTGKERWPAVSADGKTVYFSASNALLYALNNGDNPATPANDDWKPRWMYATGAGDGYFDGIKSDPLIDAAGTIYAYTSDGNIHAVNPDGTRKWRSGDYGLVSGLRDSFYFGTNLAMDADGTLYVATTGPNTQTGVTESWVWALGAAAGGVTATPTPTTAIATTTPTPAPATSTATVAATTTPTAVPATNTATATPTTAAASPTPTRTPTTALATATSGPATATATPGPTTGCTPLPANADPTRLLICASQVSATTNGTSSSGSELTVDLKTWTSWGSAWGAPATAELRVSLPAATPLRQVRWLVASNAYMDDYDVEFSGDGVVWTPLIASGPNATLGLNASTQNSNTWNTRDVTVTARYLRWSLRNPNNESKTGSLAEIEVYRQP